MISLDCGSFLNLFLLPFHRFSNFIKGFFKKRQSNFWKPILYPKIGFHSWNTTSKRRKTLEMILCSNYFEIWRKKLLSFTFFSSNSQKSLCTCSREQVLLNISIYHPTCTCTYYVLCRCIGNYLLTSILLIDKKLSYFECFSSMFLDDE